MCSDRCVFAFMFTVLVRLRPVEPARCAEGSCPSVMEIGVDVLQESAHGEHAGALARPRPISLVQGNFSVSMATLEGDDDDGPETEADTEDDNEVAEPTGGAAFLSRRGLSEATAQAQAFHESGSDMLQQEMEDLSTDVVRPPSLAAKAVARANVTRGLSARDASSRFIFASHHKTGTLLMRSIAQAFAETFKLSEGIEWWGTDRFEPRQLKGCDIPQVIALSNLDLAQLVPILRDCDFRAIQLVRDPVNVVISGYLYHSWSNDTWHMNTGPGYLGGLSMQDGLRKEAAAESDGTLTEMKDVETLIYDDLRFLDIPLESLEGSYDDTMRAIGLHLLDNSGDVESFVAAARQYDTSRWPKERRKSDKHIASKMEKEELHAIFQKLVEAGDADALRVLQFQRDLHFR